MTLRIWKWFRTNRCPHINIAGISGGEIEFAAGYRLRCLDCGLRLDGPVSLRTVDRGKS